MKTLLEQYNFNVKESNDKEILLCVGGGYLRKTEMY